MYEIEKDVPIPNVRNKNKQQIPFAEMKVGESVFVPNGTGVSAARASASWHSKVTGRRFITRTVDGGIRVWRAS